MSDIMVEAMATDQTASLEQQTTAETVRVLPSMMIQLDTTPVPIDVKKPESVERFRVAVNNIINDAEKPHLKELVQNAITEGKDVVAFVSGTGKTLLIGVGAAAILVGAALSGAVIIYQHKKEEKKD